MPENLINWEDKVNSDELLAFLQQYGPQTYLTAEEINELRDKINYLNNKPSVEPDGLISLGELIVIGNSVKFPVNVAKWRLTNTIVQNTAEFIAVIPAASANHFRTDFIVGNKLGELFREPGAEGETEAILPDIPEGTVLIKQINVFGANIDTTVPPVTANPFVTRSSFGVHTIDSDADNVYLPEVGKSIYDILNIGNQTIVGKNKNYFGGETAETLPLGMPLRIINSSGSNLIFKHNHNDQNIKPCINPAGVDVIAEPGTIISYIELANHIVLLSYSKITTNEGGVTQAYVDAKDGDTLNEAKNYTDGLVALRELASNKSAIIDDSEEKFPNNKAVKTFVGATVARKHTFVFYNTANLTADGKRFFLSQLSTGVTPYSSLSLLFSDGALDMANPANLTINDDKILGMYVPFKCKVTNITVRASKNEASAYGLNFQAMFSEAYGTGYLREIVCNDTITSAISGPGTSSSDLTKTLAILPHSVIPAYSAIKFSVGTNNGLAQNINRYFRTIITVTEVL